MKKDTFINSMKRPIHILLVEDDITINDMITNILEDAEIKVTSAFDGEEAIRKIENYVFDIILMDKMIPKLDGLEVTKIARQKGISTPILLISGVGFLNEQQCFENGITEILEKPVLFDTLFEIIEKYIGEQNDAQANYKKLKDNNIDFIKDICFIDSTIIKNSFKGLNPEKQFLSHLYNFKNQYSDFDTIFIENLENKKFDFCLIKIHNLKNLSQIIGVPILVDFTTKIEKDLKKNEITDDTKTNIEDMLNVLNCLLYDLDKYLPEQPNKKSIKEIINELKVLIDEMDYRILNFFDVNEDLLLKEFGKEIVTQLRNSIEKLDYDTASQIIEKKI